ncbi:G-protein coupled receptor dmsr-1-like [Planococcus citri]|uniref:G-protein coupled receptor dmsr-1-like n=1 Tax=Planococcus citri TaxID=170843 RepID=UPI0031F94D66
MKKPDEEPFCGDAIDNVRFYYRAIIQGYVDIPICVIGLILNIFIILVITRRNMTSPMNLIFTHLAIVDFSGLLALILSSWVNFTYYNTYVGESWTYTQAVLSIFSQESSAIFHFTSVYLITMLAIWKYIAVVHPQKECEWCDMKTTRNVVSTGYKICFLFGILLFSSHHIQTTVINSRTKIYQHYVKSDTILFWIPRIIRGVLYKLVPSVVLPILCFRLMALRLRKKQEQSVSSNVENLEMKQQTDPSIIILTTVVALRLIYIIPSGLTDLVQAVFNSDKFKIIHFGCFDSLSLTFGFLYRIIISVTFIVFYTMDQDFKVTFKSLFDKNNISFWRQNYSALSNEGKTDESSKVERV